jgi:coenzyme F420 biosynthesis associated uncharacterized protein
MSNAKLAFRAGMLLGAAAGALWVVAGRRWLESEYELLDWDRAQGIAFRTAGETPALSPWASRRLQVSYEEMLKRVENPIAGYLGAHLPLGDVPVTVMNRHQWIEANVNNFRFLFEPVEELYREVGHQAATLPGMSQISRLAVSSQLGLLLGYLARRVLGQYDMSVLGREPITSGKLYFVHQNIEAIERQLGLPGDEFRTWITLHEATHAHEFEVYPWLRDYMNNTLRAYLDCVLDEVRQARGGSGGATSLVARMVENLRTGKSLLESIMSPRQQRYVSEMQAMMSLVEGYSNHVMNAVGREIMPHYDQIKKAIEARQRERSQAERLFLKLTGLSLKMEQYRLGEQFVNHVVRDRGVQFVNRAWEGPASLPTMAEILRPERWIARMQGAS